MGVTMKYLAFALMLLLLTKTTTLASQEILINIGPNGFPPFMIKEEGKPPSGIMLEVLQKIASKYNYIVRAVEVPKKREVLQTESGEINANPIAKEWVPNPENYEFTDVIIEVRDVLFSSISHPLKYDEIEDLFGKIIGTHLGYKYPMLDFHFEDNIIQRSDNNSEKSMLAMVLMMRTDAAIVNEIVGKWLIKKKPDWHGKFNISKKDVGGFGYRIMFNKSWKPFVTKFNQELSAMKKNGELERIISKYR